MNMLIMYAPDLLGKRAYSRCSVVQQLGTGHWELATRNCN